MFPKDLWAHLQNECNVYCYFFFFFFFAVCYLFSSNIIITVHVSFLDLWFAKNKTEKCSCVHSVLLELLKLLIRGILTLFEDVETITTIASLYSPLQTQTLADHRSKTTFLIAIHP